MSKKSNDFEFFFDKIYNENISIIILFFIKNGMNRYDAEDCANETFAILWKKIKIVFSHENYKGFLFKVADNVIKRYKTKKITVKNEVSIELMINSLSSKTDYIDDHLDNVDYKNITEYIFSKLKANEIKLFKQLYIEKLKSVEIASKLNVNSANIRMKKKRLNAKLRKIIINYEKTLRL